MASYFRIQTEAWLKTLDIKADRVLDVGGSQKPIKGRTKSWEVKDYKILDLEVPHICEQKPDIIGDIQYPSTKILGSSLFLKGLFGALEGMLISCGLGGELLVGNHKPYYGEGNFDVVFCIEVSEYWFDPMQAIKNIASLMKSGSYLYITFPFVYGHHKPEGADFLRYTPAGAEKLLKEAGFEILEHKFRKATSPKLADFYAEEKMKILNNFDHEIIGSMIKAKKI